MTTPNHLIRVILYVPHSIAFRWQEDGYAKAFNEANIRCLMPEYNWPDNSEEAENYAKKVFAGDFDAILYPNQNSEILRHPRVRDYWGFDRGSNFSLFTVIEMLRDMKAPLLPCHFSFHDHFENEATILDFGPSALIKEIMKLSGGENR
jgi:hypothetical protein